MQFKRCEKSFAVSFFLSKLRLFHELKLRGKTTFRRTTYLLVKANFHHQEKLALRI